MSVGVRLALVAAAPSAVEMFLPEIPGRSHNQLLDDLASQLASDARFVPVRTASRVRLIGKHSIAWISVPRHAPDARAAGEPPAEALAEAPPVEIADEPPSDAVVMLAPEPAPDIPEELTLFDHQHFVEVELAHGSKLIGTLLDSESADFSRLGDHLNRSGYWLRLWTPDQHYLINAGQVVAVTELGEVW
jgi:hypothetical protein